MRRYKLLKQRLDMNLSLKEVQNVMLEMILYIDKICREKDIKYSLFYGSLLGAIRHEGFIPWDDDFDIILTRENYEKLLAHLRADTKSSYYLGEIENGAIYDMRCVKLYHKNYYAKSINPYDAVNKEFSIAIDIFVLHKLPENGKELYLIDLINSLKDLRKTDLSSYYKSGKKKRNIYKAILLFPRTIYYKFFVTRARLLKRLRELEIKYENEEAKECGVAVYYPGRKLREIYNKEYFENYVDISFCGHKLMCIKEYDTVLRMIYDDYLTPPPEEQRKMHYLFYKKKLEQDQIC